MADQLEVRLLGPIEVWSAGRQIALGGLRQRTVLTSLALRVGHSVGITELVDAIWPEAPPTTARQQVHSAVSSLRRTLGGLITTTPCGYQLTVSAERVDTELFHVAVADAMRTADTDRLEAAVDRFRAALALWRGPALASITGLHNQALAFEEQRLCALEECFELELRLGRHVQVVAELSLLVAAHPIRERLVGQLMLALYRSGRASAALDIYRHTRSRLARELGLDPGPDLNELELAMLRGDPGLVERPALSAQGAPTAPKGQLPPVRPSLTGRSAELDVLTTLAGSVDDRAPVIVVTGPAGVGKTALALAWAHQVADRFPDGQLYVDLRGFGPDQVFPPDDAVLSLLDELAVPATRVPPGSGARIALYRSLLATRRTLVVLDNARDAEQARSLLPGAPRCPVVVTSRNRLSSLVAVDGAMPLPLAGLPPGDASSLLAHRLGPHRVAAEPTAAERILAAAAGLPLAVVVLATRLTTHPGFTLAALADELATPSGLDAFTDTDRATDLETVFSWSYQLLGSPAARLFRLLCLHPGPDIGVAAAASLVGQSSGRIRPLLSELDTIHLVTEHTPGRFARHPLLHVYAAELARRLDSPDERRAARRRLLDHYLQTLSVVVRALNIDIPPPRLPPPLPGVIVAEPADRHQAMRWLSTEQPVLSAISAGSPDSDGIRSHQFAELLDATLDRCPLLGVVPVADE